MIEFKNVGASYDGELAILRDVSFRIPDGDFVAFVGTNGAGKSTTMRLVNGLLKPTAGEVLIDGVPTTQLRTNLRRRWASCSKTPTGRFAAQPCARSCCSASGRRGGPTPKPRRAWTP